MNFDFNRKPLYCCSSYRSIGMHDPTCMLSEPQGNWEVIVGEPWDMPTETPPQKPHPLSWRELPRTAVLTCTVLPLMLFGVTLLLVAAPIKLMMLIVDRHPKPLWTTAKFIAAPITDWYQDYFR